MIKLTFRSQHLSIKDLPETDLPDFAVLTGINGSGKTHLLEAIRDGRVDIDGISNQKIRLFNWNDLVSSTGENSDPQALRQEREAAISTVFSKIKSARDQIASFFPESKFSGESQLADYKWLLSATPDEVRICAGRAQVEDPHTREPRIQKFLKRRDAITREAAEILEGQFGELIEYLRIYSEEHGCHFLGLSESEIRHVMPPYWKSPDLLRYQFADWFMAYHSTWELNRIDRYYAEVHGEDRIWTTDEQFIKKFGPKPWETTNEILSNAGLRYQFNYPIGAFDTPFNLRLIDESSDVEVRTQDLSSGEKILLSIALLLHQSGTETGLAALPKLLLLDEIDAPLHPSFTRALIQTLNETLVQKCGLRIILTTHSPSTVALAPPASLYELIREPRAIVKCSPSHAIRELTSGFISVAPSSVIVITESNFDAEIYSKYLQAIQRRGGEGPPGSLPLTFLPASHKDDAGNGGGCTQVENWAPKLNDLAKCLGDFRGLIDRDDGKRSETDVIRVLNRYSIENYLLDPLTVVAILIQDGVTCLFSNCPITDGNVHLLPDLDEPALQAMVDALCAEIERVTPDLARLPGRDPVDYYCGKALQIPKWCIDLRGHESAADPHCLKAVYARSVNPLCVNAGKLPVLPSGKSFYDRCLDMQTRLLPAILPVDLVKTLRDLQRPAQTGVAISGDAGNSQKITDLGGPVDSASKEPEEIP